NNHPYWQFLSEIQLGNKALIDRHIKGERAPDGYPFAIKSIGKLPWWVDASNGSVKPHEYYFPVAQWLIQQALTGIGVTSLVNQLNQLFTPPNGKEQWHYSMVNRFHKSNSLLGTGSFKIDDTIHSLPDYFPVVTTEEELLLIRAKKRSATHSRTSSNPKTVLSGMGILKCRCCHGGVSFTTTAGYSAYRCINGMQSKAKCNGLSVSSTYVDDAVKQSLTWFSTQPKPAIIDKVTPLKGKLFEVESRLAQMEADYMDSPSSVLARMITNLESEVGAIRSELDEAITTEVVQSFPSESPETVDEYRDAILRSIDRVYLYKLGRKKILVSIYFKMGINTHVAVKDGDVILASSFYDCPDKENQLMDKTNFLLWVEQGHLETWLGLSKK
ncbi:zinc ribbon domain-containing protein, partial [Vibrio crassostreae]|uniref:zinc ribbon domain-containing protein n=1 Tax=Vibrio crassostreae TaxID=246167 RepID=UPI001B3166DE